MTYVDGAAAQVGTHACQPGTEAREELPQAGARKVLGVGLALEIKTTTKLKVGIKIKAISKVGKAIGSLQRATTMTLNLE